MQNWTCIDKIFTGKIKVFSDMRYGDLTKEDLLRINPPQIETSTIKPVTHVGDLRSLVYQEIIRIYRDGRIERRYPYHARQPICDNTVVLNPIGKKMVDYIIFKDEEEKENGAND